jgi:hypothetical protein
MGVRKRIPRRGDGQPAALIVCAAKLEVADS